MPKTSRNFNPSCSAPFPPPAKTSIIQQVEINRGRYEARCLIPFAATAEQVCFPGVAQAGRLTRFVDRKKPKNKGIETEWLISSRSSDQLPSESMLVADRYYWGIENGLHLRLDVSGGEDRSRVRHRTSAFNLAIIRRATLSVAIHWIQRCHNPRQATLRGFYDFMSAKNTQKAFSLLTTNKPNWLPK